MFACALALSGAAAFYSIVGLMAIFAAAPIPIMIMGSLLEVSKLVIASWLYRNWKEVPALMKGYFTSALVILMFLTSMGIFGFLSKAHLDQNVPSGEVAAKVAILDEKIKTEKENINAARRTLSQLDSQVDAALSRTTDAAGADRSSTIRRSQAKERARILEEITTAQKAISTYTTEKTPIAAELRKVEAEVGPIKYIAALIYGEDSSHDTLEKAVRWVTILIVSVFDPLAVIMLIAANWSLMRRRKENLPEPDIYKEKVDAPEENIPKPDVPEEFLPEVSIDSQITDAVTSTISPESVVEPSATPSPLYADFSRKDALSATPTSVHFGKLDYNFNLNPIFEPESMPEEVIETPSDIAPTIDSVSPTPMLPNPTLSKGPNWRLRPKSR